MQAVGSRVLRSRQVGELPDSGGGGALTRVHHFVNGLLFRWWTRNVVDAGVRNTLAVLERPSEGIVDRSDIGTLDRGPLLGLKRKASYRNCRVFLFTSR
jgi:hypothetical protein